MTSHPMNIVQKEVIVYVLTRSGIPVDVLVL